MTVIEFSAHQRLRPAATPCHATTPKDRDGRDWHWNKAEMHLEFLERLRSVAMYSRILCERYNIKEGEAYKGLDDFELLGRIRAAQAVLMLTPVYRKANLERKHRVLKRCQRYIEVDARALAKVLAADAAYLAIPKGERRKAVQS